MTGVEPGGSAAAPRVIAHRGASARWPEHSRRAYEQALADGADGLECDVRLTADDVPVCWHDADLDRTSDGTGPVRAHTLDRLRTLRLRGRTPDEDQPGGLLTVAELLDLALGAGRPVRLAIELKHPSPYGFAAEDAVVDLLEAAGWDPVTGSVGAVRVSLMSFHPGSLRHLLDRVPAGHLMVLLDDLDVRAAVAEHAPTRLLTPLAVVALRRLQRQAGRLADGVVGGVGPSVAFLVAHPERVARWRADGALVRVWTVDGAADLELCRQARVDEVTSNVPDRLLRLLGR